MFYYLAYSYCIFADTKNAIRAFKPAEWVKSKNNPFTMNDNGFLTARYTGVHLIYAQVSGGYQNFKYS